MTQPRESDIDSAVVVLSISITLGGTDTTVLPPKRVTVAQYDKILEGLATGVKAASALEGPKW